MSAESTRQRANERACFVGGAGHSGSTLLGLLLGAHPRVFYAGEARKSAFLGDENKPLKKRTCKLCGPSCPIWSDTSLRDVPDLYEELSRRTGRPVVVDSTKSLDWIESRLALYPAPPPALTLFLLSRDGRAVVNSRLRKYPHVSPSEHALAWAAQMRATEALAARFPGNVLRLRYEELATAPEATLRTACAALGVDFDPRMLEPWTTEQHPLGGNNGTQSLMARETAPQPTAKNGAFYATHPQRIVLDVRWRRELSAAALAEFESVAGEWNRAYAWEGE